MTPVNAGLRTLLTGVLLLLIVCSAMAWLLERRVRHRPAAQRALAQNISARIRAWWLMAVVFAVAVVTGAAGTIVLFALVSFLALREFITLAPSSRGDHSALVWAFFIVTPLQYALVWIAWYGLFSILIPVYVSMFLAIRTVLAGDTARFLERTAVGFWGLMLCVYFVSYVPALWLLRIPGYEGRNAELMFFLVLVVELSDVLQFVWGKAIGRHAVAPSISPNKTWEGLVGGIVSATTLGAALWWATPFSPTVAAGMALLATLLGFAGGLVMSAIKRDRGVKDFGTLLDGHGGILDRIDSLCFAAPVFFHVTRYLYVP